MSTRQEHSEEEKKTHRLESSLSRATRVTAAAAAARPLPDLKTNDVVPFDEFLKLANIAVQKREIHCFISRAWEVDPNHSNHLLTTRLANDLRQAGINVQLDESDLKPGTSIEKYINQIADSNFFVIALFTLTYKERERIPNSWIAKEVTMIAKRLQRGESHFYVPLLLEGSGEDSIPDRLSPKEILYIDFRDEKDYARNVVAILRNKLLHPELLLTNEEIKCSVTDRETAETVVQLPPVKKLAAVKNLLFNDAKHQKTPALSECEELTALLPFASNLSELNNLQVGEESRLRIKQPSIARRKVDGKQLQSIERGDVQLTTPYQSLSIVEIPDEIDLQSSQSRAQQYLDYFFARKMWSSANDPNTEQQLRLQHNWAVSLSIRCRSRISIWLKDEYEDSNAT